MKDIEILVQLLTEKSPQTATELSQQLGISTRTVYRWIDQLVSENIPITCSKGRKGGIYIAEDFVANKPAKNVNLNWLEIDFSETEIQNKIDTKYVTCRDAVVYCHILDFTYSLSETKILNCSTEPVKLFLHDNQWHILAWIRQVEKYKLFKLSNMNNITDTQKVFSRKIDFSIHDMLNK